jgi:hypothetical protein
VGHRLSDAGRELIADLAARSHLRQAAIFCVLLPCALKDSKRASALTYWLHADLESNLGRCCSTQWINLRTLANENHHSARSWQTSFARTHSSSCHRQDDAASSRTAEVELRTLMDRADQLPHAAVTTACAQALRNVTTGDPLDPAAFHRLLSARTGIVNSFAAVLQSERQLLLASWRRHPRSNHALAGINRSLGALDDLLVHHAGAARSGPLLG